MNISAIARLIVLSSAGLTACAAPPGKYPDFAIPEPAENGRVSGTLSPFEEGSIPDPGQSAEPLPEQLDERIAALNTAGEEAQRAFAQASAQAARLVEAARGADPQSESWMRAQVALADLTAHRSRTSLALADIDLISSRAQVNVPSQDAARSIADAQTRLAGYLAEQSRILTQLFENLGA